MLMIRFQDRKIYTWGKYINKESNIQKVISIERIQILKRHIYKTVIQMVKSFTRRGYSNGRYIIT